MRVVYQLPTEPSEVVTSSSPAGKPSGRTAQGGTRTHRHPGLGRAARPIGVPGLREAEAVGLEPTSGLGRHLFSRQAPDPAGWLPSVVTISSPKFRGLESNQRPPRSERGVTTSSNYPGVIASPIREGGFEPPPPDSKSGSLPVSRFPRAPCGSRTRLSGLGSPCLAARPRTLSITVPVRDRGFEPR